MADSTAAQLDIVSDNNREEREGPAASYIVSDTNVEAHQKKMSDRKSGIAGKASDIHEASRGMTVPPPAMPPFDTATSVLGTRCAHGHTHGRTCQSLRNTHSGECVRGVAARQAKRCQGKRTSPGRLGLHTAEGLFPLDTRRVCGVEKGRGSTIPSAAFLRPVQPSSARLATMRCRGLRGVNTIWACGLTRRLQQPEGDET